MITDNQARKLMKYLQKEKTLEVAAAKSGMGGRFHPESVAGLNRNG
jgi:predicted ArsR family transcriptional regulator